MNQKLLYRRTWLVWFAYIAVIISIMLITKDHRTETPHYLNATLRWLHGLPLYNNHGTDFIYLPQSAVLYIPFSWLPHYVSEILWRVLSIGVFAYGVSRFAKLRPEAFAAQTFLYITLICFGIAFDGARNGQMNIIMAGLLLLGVSSLNQQAWNRSAIFLTLALAIKPTAIVTWLLVAALYPVMSWRLLLGLVMMFLLPFFTQSPSYVLAQYHACLTGLGAAAQLGSQGPVWSQLFGMLGDLFGMNVSPADEYIIRIIAAFVTLAVCFYIKKRNNRATAIIYLYTFAACYLMLFNPRTENNDYAILAPAIGMFLAQAIPALTWARISRIIVLLIITLGLTESYTIMHSFTPYRWLWLSPLMTVCFTLVVLGQGLGGTLRFAPFAKGADSRSEAGGF